MLVCSFRPSSLAGLRDVGPRRVQSSFCTCSKTLRATLSSRLVCKSWIQLLVASSWSLSVLYCVSNVNKSCVNLFWWHVVCCANKGLKWCRSKKHWLLKVYQSLGGYVLLHLLVSYDSSYSFCVFMSSGLQEILVLCFKDMKLNSGAMCHHM